jgi:ZipA, C-terminal FtsZ-binding domain
VAAVQQIALAVDADFDGADVARLVNQAADLDRLCARFDVQITLTIETTAPIDRNTLAVAATEQGLASAGVLRWERRSVTGPIFAMAPVADPIERIALSLDVPLVPPDAAPLPQLFSCAEKLAARLNGRIVDDNGRVVQPGAQVAIETQLVALYADMRAAGIEPGSVRARRLYSA